MEKLHNAFNRVAQAVSYAAKSFALVAGRLLGIKQLDDGRFDTTRLVTAIWVFLFGVPIGLVIAGAEFPVLGWFTVVIAFLIFANFDHSIDLATELAERKAVCTQPPVG